MKQLFEYLNLPFRKFQIQLVIYILLIGLIPFAFAVYFYSQSMAAKNERELHDQLLTAHLQTLERFNQAMDSVKGAARAINSDYLIQSHMKDDLDESNIDRYNLERQLDTLIQVHKQNVPFITDICIVFDTSVFDTSYCPNVEIIPQEGQRLPSSVSDSVAEPMPISDDSQHIYGIRYIGTLSLIHSYSNLIKGYIVIVVNIGGVMDDYHRVQPNIVHSITDSNGMVLFRFGRALSKVNSRGDEFSAAVIDEKNGWRTSERDIRIGRDTWNSYFSIPDPAHGTFGLLLRKPLMIYVALLLLLTGMSTLLYSGLFLKPLHNLRILMKRAERGDLKAYWTARSVEEINDLGESYNQMLNRLEELIKQVKLEESLKKEAEIAALQYQLNPHFLYNTLNTIKWVAKLHKTPQIGEVVSALVRLLQASLGKKGDFLTIREEIALIQDYMDIQRFRYGDQVELQFEIETVASLCLVPRMILQPLVENALIHGLEPQKHGGMIMIRAFLDRDMLICEVEDDGVGMAHLRENKGIGGVKEKMSGIGLQHIRDKIKLYYGHDYKMHVFPRKPSGTRIRLSLPIHRNEE